MTEFILEAARVFAGVSFGILAIYCATITVRALLGGQDAYNINRNLTPKKLYKVWSGALDEQVVDGDKRLSHGIAIDLKTKRLSQQRRLSSEAIEDVIGRQA